MIKNLLTFILTVAIVGFIQAQMVDVTISVNVSNETVDATGVHVAGNWDPDNTWNPGAFPLTDGGSGVWYTTIQVAANSTFEYKFLLGNDWGLGNEGLDSEAGCVVGGGNTNRILSIGTDAYTAPTVCYNSCGPCKAAGEQSVTFKVDLRKEANINDQIIVTGSFAGWGDTYFLRDDNKDSIYATTVNIPSGDYEYKFKNGPDGWESPSGSCVVNGNRALTVADQDIILNAVCFAECGPCVQKNILNVTFLVDMSLVKDIEGISANGVHMAGNLQRKAGFPGDWDPSTTQLLDNDGDNIYEITVSLEEGEYEYKYLNGNAWGTEESIPQDCIKPGTPNRGLSLSGNNGDNVTVGPICFASCTAECPVLGDPVNITFRVDMTNEFVDANGLFVAGDFFIPKWKKDTLEMVESATAPGVYTYTVAVRPGIKYVYKYFNGGNDAGQETGDFIAGECGVDNGFGGSNRLLDLTDVDNDYDTPVYIFNTCDQATVSTKNFLNPEYFAAYPNPAHDVLTIDFSNTRDDAHQVILTDINGKIVALTNLMKGNQIQIQRNGLAPGFYLGRLVNEAGASHAFKITFQ